jgi:hypothetical protein
MQRDAGLARVGGAARKQVGVARVAALESRSAAKRR